MAPLYGAVALAQVDPDAVLVAQHLHLDVARVLDELLAVDLRRVEGGAGFGLARVERLHDLGPLPDDPHATPAAAGGSFEHDRIADPVRHLERLGRILQGDLAPRHDRHARLHRDLSRLRLVTHEADRLGRRTDERDGAGPAHLGEGGVLGQEPVARVDRLAVGDGRRGDDRRDVEIAQARGVGPDADRLVGHAHGQRVRVGLRVRQHRADAELAAGADDPQRDFTTIGDQDLVEHGSARAPSHQPPRTRRHWDSSSVSRRP